MALTIYIICYQMHIVFIIEKKLSFIHIVRCDLKILKNLNFFAMATAYCKNEWFPAIAIYLIMLNSTDVLTLWLKEGLHC